MNTTQGLIFDLDGTLIHSDIDFKGMRQALGLVQGEDILGTIATWEDAKRQEAEQIIHDFEHEAALQMTLMPGVAEMFLSLWSKGIKTGIVTRNTSHTVDLFLERLAPSNPNLLYPRLDRSFQPPKPEPDALLHIVNHWDLSPEQTIMVGDTHHDMFAARAANMRFILISQSYNAELEQEDHTSGVVRDDMKEVMLFL